MFARECRSAGHKRAVLVVVAAAGMLLLADTASAQGLFDFLFGRRSAPEPPSPPVRAYAPSGPAQGPSGSSERRYGESGRYTAYCVRLCDGRYFPIQREAGKPAELCKAFCPATPTKVFSGSGIDYAVAQDGTRYDKLKNAFVYRDKVVADCTCNGKNPLGVARLEPKDDPTLRPGDVIATKNGLMAYSGSSRSRNGEFTPVQSYSGMSKEMRRKLSELKVMPTPEPRAPQTTSTVGQSSRDAPQRAQTSR